MTTDSGIRKSVVCYTALLGFGGLGGTARRPEDVEALIDLGLEFAEIPIENINRIKHLHLHDNLGGNAPTVDLHLPPGKGTVDFTALFEGLRKAGYQGTATLELKPEEIRSCLEFIRALSF